MQKDNFITAVLMSGGMDSMALAYWKCPDYLIYIDYGQVCSIGELRASKHFAEKTNIPLEIIRVDCSSIGSGSLSGTSKKLAESPSEEWWPFRNQLLVTLAGAKCIELGIKKLCVGSVNTDSALHKDGGKEFYAALNTLMTLQEGNISVEAPAVNMSTLDLIKASKIPMDLLSWSFSCHTSNHPCMQCSGCKKNTSIRFQLGIY